MGYIQVLRAIPLIVDTVKTVEASLPPGVGGKGREKLHAALDLITTVDASLTDLTPTITKVIGTFVTLFNAVGWGSGEKTPTTTHSTLQE